MMQRYNIRRGSTHHSTCATNRHLPSRHGVTHTMRRKRGIPCNMIFTRATRAPGHLPAARRACQPITTRFLSVSLEVSARKAPDRMQPPSRRYTMHTARGSVHHLCTKNPLACVPSNPCCVRTYALINGFRQERTIRHHCSMAAHRISTIPDLAPNTGAGTVERACRRGRPWPGLTRLRLKVTTR